MLVSSFIKSLHNLLSASFVKVLIYSFVISACILSVFLFSSFYFIQQAISLSSGWLAQLLNWVAAAGAGLSAWFLFPVFIPLIAGFFSEKIANDIEKKDYGIISIGQISVFQDLNQNIRFTAKALILNILCLPLYITGFLFPLVYYPLNAWLLGRQFFEMTTARHIGYDAAFVIRKNNKISIWILGGILLFMSNLPIIQLIVPFFGVAIMVHYYQLIRPAKV